MCTPWVNPQTVHQLGGYKVQGRDAAHAERIINDAKVLVEAGASVILLECVPASLGKAVTAALDVPVIGIGAGPDTDGQILVMHDVLGVTHGRTPRFVKTSWLRLIAFKRLSSTTTKPSKPAPSRLKSTVSKHRF